MASARIAASVARQLGKFMLLKYHRQADGASFDPITRTYGAASAPVDGHGALTPPTNSYIMRIGQDALPKDKETQLLFLEPGLGFLPVIGDYVVTPNGETWTIQRPEQITPAGIPVLYIALVTR